MTDLGTLRKALRAEQPLARSAGQYLDVDQIIAQGRRLRWRRRLAVGGAAAACAAAAVSGVLAGTSHPGRAAPVPAQRPASPSHSVRQMPPTYLPPSRSPAPTPSATSARTPDPMASPSSLSGISTPSPSLTGSPPRPSR